MKLLVGWGLSGPVYAPHGERGARLGEPVWGRTELLRDLELRLGLAGEEAPAGERVSRFQARMAKLADPAAFYASSFAVDPLGTAQALLGWRDALVEAGWDGSHVAGGGDRLDALARLEAWEDDCLPAAVADRLVRVQQALERRECKTRVYAEVSLVERRDLWSQRWQRIFALLEASHTRFSALQPVLPGASPDTDLGRLQSLLRGSEGAHPGEPPSALRGDGSLLMLRGETPAELAELTAACLDAWRSHALVIRCLDAAPLEAVLPHHGLAPQGHKSSSQWRPAMQILPLALELAYEPRDPYRVLELLTLPIGPFRGRIGRALARAICEQPGIGGQPWLRAKESLLADLIKDELGRQTEAGQGADEHAAQASAEKKLQRVHDWLEIPGANAAGATREALLAITARVQSWLQKRLAMGDREVYGAAYAQAGALTAALANETRPLLSREDLRHLLDTLVRGVDRQVLSVERAGRIPHVNHPSALLAPAGSVVFWGFVSGTEKRPSLPPFQRAELAALRTLGISFPDPGQLLAIESEAWRRGILSATQRVVFVVPSRVCGAAMSPHPIWDEICARLGLENAGAAARITRQVDDLLHARGTRLASIESLTALDLPEERGEWALPSELITSDAADDSTSASDLTTLASCPLSWVLTKRAKLRSGSVRRVPENVILYGKLTHRLVEGLFQDGAFEREEAAFLVRSHAVLDELIPKEAATLLLPGNSFELMQLRPQIHGAMRGLFRYLKDAGFRIAGVEEEVKTESTAGNFHGRLDLRLVNHNGMEAVLDLKWGAATYQELLKSGRAVQLAMYARAISGAKPDGKYAPAGYFAINGGRVLTADSRMGVERTIDGQALEETWSMVERTALTVKKALRTGRVPVSATRSAKPLLDVLQVPVGEQPKYFSNEPDAPCKYCAHKPICGRAWESFQ